MGSCQGKKMYKAEKIMVTDTKPCDDLCVMNEAVAIQGESGKSQLPNQQFKSYIASCINNGYIEDNIQLPSGEGYLEWTYEDGSRYEGNWKNKTPSGKGKLWMQNGDIFEGQFVDGQLIQGAHVQNNGNNYTGEFMNGMYHGYGQLTEFFGDTYSGQFSEGMKQGKGILKKIDGTIYDGEWNQNIQNGFGLCVWKDDSRYEGQWKENLMHGQGTYCWKGRKYVGEYNYGQKHGKGIYYWKSNTYYTGQWLHGLQNGKGILVINQQVVQSGVWKDGVFQGEN